MNPLNEATNITYKAEKELLRKLHKEYSRAYTNAYKELKDTMSKMPKGKLTQADMMKYDRLDKLIKNIQVEMKSAGAIQDFQMKTYLKNAYEVNYYHTGYAVDSTLGIKTGFSAVDRKQVEAVINNPLMKIAIDDNKVQVLQDIQRTLTQSVVQGEGIQDTAKKLKDRIDVSLSRATRIVRTETTKVMAKARVDGMERVAKAGIEIQKEWVATLDNRTREEHEELDGERVGVDENFSNGSPSPDEVNCRCTVVTYFPQYSVDKKDTYGYENYKDWKKQNGI